MSTTYAQKQAPAQKKDAPSASSILDASSQNETLQRKADMANNATQRVEAPRPNNTGMPDNLKSGIESLSGFSMDNVRVHYNSSKPATVQALAYTQGTDIHVAPGQEKHLPHEAWHVAQQMAGRVSPTTTINGMSVNDNVGLEHEADVMGAKAVQMKADESKTVQRATIGDGVVQRNVYWNIGGRYNTTDGYVQEKPKYGQYLMREGDDVNNRLYSCPEDAKNAAKTVAENQVKVNLLIAGTPKVSFIASNNPPYSVKSEENTAEGTIFEKDKIIDVSQIGNAFREGKPIIYNKCVFQVDSDSGTLKKRKLIKNGLYGKESDALDSDIRLFGRGDIFYLLNGEERQAYTVDGKTGDAILAHHATDPNCKLIDNNGKTYCPIEHWHIGSLPDGDTTYNEDKKNVPQHFLVKPKIAPPPPQLEEETPKKVTAPPPKKGTPKKGTEKKGLRKKNTK